MGVGEGVAILSGAIVAHTRAVSVGQTQPSGTGVGEAAGEFDWQAAKNPIRITQKALIFVRMAFLYNSEIYLMNNHDSH